MLAQKSLKNLKQYNHVVIVLDIDIVIDIDIDIVIVIVIDMKIAFFLIF